MGTVSIVLGVLAGATQLLGYYLYGKTVKRPNAASWAIWAFAALLDLGSYAVMTGDWVKNVLPVACAIASIWIFVKGFLQKQFSKPDRKDVTILGVDIAITTVWAFTNATVANVLYQVTTGISFIPLIRGIGKDGCDEKPVPWLVWSLAYAFLFASVLMRLEKWEELLYPAVNLVIHIFVWAQIPERAR